MGNRSNQFSEHGMEFNERIVSLRFKESSDPIYIGATVALGYNETYKGMVVKILDEHGFAKIEFFKHTQMDGYYSYSMDSIKEAIEVKHIKLDKEPDIIPIKRREFKLKELNM